jgi:hypothetical protein
MIRKKVKRTAMWGIDPEFQEKQEYLQKVREEQGEAERVAEESDEYETCCGCFKIIKLDTTVRRV